MLGAIMLSEKRIMNTNLGKFRAMCGLSQVAPDNSRVDPGIVRCLIPSHTALSLNKWRSWHRQRAWLRNMLTAFIELRGVLMQKSVNNLIII